MLFRSPPPSGPRPPSPTPPPGWVISEPGPAAVGANILYWWPSDGWQQGVVARERTTGGFSHVVRYRRPTSALHGAVDTLLDAASYGTRWVRLASAPA